MLGVVKLFLAFGLVLNAEGRFYSHYNDESDMSDLVRRAAVTSKPQQAVTFPAFPDDDDQEFSGNDYQEQDANQKELEKQRQQNQQRPSPTYGWGWDWDKDNVNGGRGTTDKYNSQQQQNSGSGGREFDFGQQQQNGGQQGGNYYSRQTESVTERYTERPTTENVPETTETLPWWKKVGKFAHKTYNKVISKIRGERGYYNDN